MEAVRELLHTQLLSLIVFLPLVGAVLVIAWPRGRGLASGWVALAASALVLLASLYMLCRFDPGTGNFQMEVKGEWISTLKIKFHLAVDGLSLFLVVLTALLTPLAILCSRGDTAGRPKEFFALLLFLESGLLGTFLALDTFLFYVFWELVLIPMYFLIGIWGGPRRVYATFKFVLYTMAGSLLMLVAIIYLGYQHQLQFGYFSTALSDLYALNLSFSEQLVLFLFFALAFAIKVPFWPLHTWLPDAHVEAPTAGSVLLAGVLLKMGGYGFLRFAFPLFPEAALHCLPALTVLALAGVVLGALLALAQKDLKKLVAYSSVSHMGLVMVGLLSLSPLGTSGGLYQMLNHGLSTGALFLLVGIIYHRRHSREISAFGGLASSVPLFSVVFVVVVLSSIGLPGLNGFIGEFLVLAGTFTGGVMPQARWVAALAALGMVLGATYMLWMVQRVFFGRLVSEENRRLADLNRLEIGYLLPILLLIVLLGVYPQPVLRRLEPAVVLNLQRIEAKLETTRSAQLLPPPRRGP